MRALRTAVVLVLALALPAPVLAADFEAGLDAANRGDYATALKEWRPLAEQGDADAQFHLGLMYDFGEGVAQDRTEAAKWFHLAAEQGHAPAQSFLGLLYMWGGEGVTQNYVLAHMWSSLAAARLRPSELHDKAAHNRDLVATQMTPEQLAEAQRLASEWKPK